MKCSWHQCCSGFKYTTKVFIFDCSGSSLLCTDYSLIAMHGLPIAVASLVELRLSSTGSAVVANGVSCPRNVGSSWTGDWSSALAGGFLTTGPPGSPYIYFLNLPLSLYLKWVSGWQHIIESKKKNLLNLCLLIGLFRSFTFNGIIAMSRLKSTVLFFDSVCYFVWPCLFLDYFSVFFLLPSSGSLEYFIKFYFDVSVF